MSRTRLSFTLPPILLIILALAACSSGPLSTPPTATISGLSSPATATQVPTPTPPSPAVVLLASDQADPQALQALQTTLADLASTSGLAFETRAALSASELEPTWKVVVALPPDPGLAALAAAAPQTQFVAIGIENVPAGANLTTIGGRPARRRSKKLSWRASSRRLPARIGARGF